nr:calcium/proton exchanger [Tanacetum cinerariifolium]
MDDSRSSLSRSRPATVARSLTPSLDRSRRPCFMLATSSPRSVNNTSSWIWCRMHLYEMFIILNPNHENLLHNEINRQARIEELEGELFENGAQLRRCEASLTFWKHTFLAFFIFLKTVKILYYCAIKSELKVGIKELKTDKDVEDFLKAKYGVATGYQLWYTRNDWRCMLVYCGRNVKAGSPNITTRRLNSGEGCSKDGEGTSRDAEKSPQSPQWTKAKDYA